MMNNKSRFCNNIPGSARENPVVKPAEHVIVYPGLPEKSTQAEYCTPREPESAGRRVSPCPARIA